MYEGYHFWGMHLLWWLIWAFVIIWVFATPYEIPYQRYKKEGPLDILQRRLAMGEIDNSEYHEKRKMLEK